MRGFKPRLDGIATATDAQLELTAEIRALLDLIAELVVSDALVAVGKPGDDERTDGEPE